MDKKNKINKTLIDFYLSSNLPIQAFEFDGHNIGQEGYNEKFNWFFSNYRVYEEIINNMEKVNSSFTTISILPHTYYTGCYISPGNSNSGLYILGPYSCRKRNDLGAVYKPKCLIKHLVSLLRIIGEDSPYSEDIRCLDNKVYSLHVRRTMDFLNYRYMEEISLDSMVAYLGINKSYFCSIFKAETGKTFTQYLNEIRIHKSKYLLVESNDSILDIALAVGYNNQNYYNIIFKKIMNTTPLNYRNQNNKVISKENTSSR